MNKTAKGVCYAGLTLMTGVATYAMGRLADGSFGGELPSFAVMMAGAALAFVIPIVPED